MDRPTLLGIGAVAALTAGVIGARLLFPSGPVVMGQLADGGPTPCVGPCCTGPCFDAGAPVWFTLHDSPSGRHASVAAQCPGTGTGHTCDFQDDVGVRHIVVENGAGLTIQQGGMYSAIVQAPDGGWVAQ